VPSVRGISVCAAPDLRYTKAPPPVCAQAVWTAPRFGGGAIEDAFSARAVGSRAAHGMEKPMQHPAQLLRSAPYFPVADLEQAAAHYERVFGFRREYVGGTPPQFAILSRDGLAVMLRLVAGSERIVPNEQQGGTWDAFFWVSDAQALHAELRGNGAEIVYGPVVQDAYHMKEFAVRDREGYVLGFGQPLAATAQAAAS
jgi:hypothetical protein